MSISPRSIKNYLSKRETKFVLGATFWFLWSGTAYFQSVHLASAIGCDIIRCHRESSNVSVTCTHSETFYWGIVRSKEQEFINVTRAEPQRERELIDGSGYSSYWLTVQSNGQERIFIGVPPSPLWGQERISGDARRISNIAERINDFIDSDELDIEFSELKDKSYTYGFFSIWAFIMMSYILLREWSKTHQDNIKQDV